MNRLFLFCHLLHQPKLADSDWFVEAVVPKLVAALEGLRNPTRKSQRGSFFLGVAPRSSVRKSALAKDFPMTSK